MQDDRGKRDGGRDGAASAETREQRAGEGATTRFGMEDSESTEAPATGGPAADEEETD